MNRIPRLYDGRSARCGRCKTTIAKSDPKLQAGHFAFRKLREKHAKHVTVAFWIAGIIALPGIFALLYGMVWKLPFIVAAFICIYAFIYGWTWITPPETFKVDTIPTPLGGVIVTWSGAMDSSILVPKFRAILETDPYADLVKYGERLNINVHEVERPFAEKDLIADQFTELLKKAKSLIDVQKLHAQFLKEHPEVDANPELKLDIEMIFTAYSQSFKL